MKTNLCLLILNLFLFVACEKDETPKLDLKAEKTAIETLLNTWQTATQTNALASCMSDDAIVAGTAPAEIFTKQELVDMWTLYYSGQVPEHTYIGEPTIKMALDGNSATAVEEYNMPSMSSVLAARNTLHLVKSDGKWMIDFMSITYIPKNEDVPKIDEVLSE